MSLPQEEDRLADVDVSGLLWRRPNPRLQIIAELAAELLERPMAALSFFTRSEQFFCNRFGFAVRQIPRDVSFCVHTLSSPGRPLVVDDARRDPRFADNALVTGEFGLRSYAGVAIRSAGGQPLGALCVLDRKPGGITDPQADILRSLARKAEEVIETIRPAAQERRVMLHALRQAVLGGALTLVWQPVLDARTLQVRDHEALVRWTGPAGVAIGPDQFIPLAEANGLIARIDRLVLEMACREAARSGGPAAISVNVSPRWFRPSSPSLANAVAAVLARTGLQPERLTLELTERVLINDPEYAAAKFGRLKALGVRLALDDFGTGYSSLSYLRRFPFDVVKLDRNFVGELGLDPRADSVARAAIRLGKELGMEICAEGVEDPRQLAFLRHEGCDLVQGYLTGRPSPLPRPSASRH